MSRPWTDFSAAVSNNIFCLSKIYHLSTSETMTNINSKNAITIRQAQENDLQSIIAFIDPFVAQGKLLRRTFKELQSLFDQYLVAESDGKIVGCVVLEIYSPKLAEIRSLAVSPDCQ